MTTFQPLEAILFAFVFSLTASAADCKIEGEKQLLGTYTLLASLDGKTGYGDSGKDPGFYAFGHFINEIQISKVNGTYFKDQECAIQMQLVGKTSKKVETTLTVPLSATQGNNIFYCEVDPAFKDLDRPCIQYFLGLKEEPSISLSITAGGQPLWDKPKPGYDVYEITFRTTADPKVSTLSVTYDTHYLEGPTYGRKSASIAVLKKR
jgi:hypothetical protein